MGVEPPGRVLDHVGVEDHGDQAPHTHPPGDLRGRAGSIEPHHQYRGDPGPAQFVHLQTGTAAGMRPTQLSHRRLRLRCELTGARLPDVNSMSTGHDRCQTTMVARS